MPVIHTTCQDDFDTWFQAWREDAKSCVAVILGTRTRYLGVPELLNQLKPGTVYIEFQKGNPVPKMVDTGNGGYVKIVYVRPEMDAFAEAIIKEYNAVVVYQD
jgi:hypothetical protein